MPANKHHHFVPQFYLRNFSPDRSSVSSFNFKNSKYLPVVSISRQCQRPYFYGKDQAREKGMKRFENVWAPLVHYLVNARAPLPNPSADHLFLLLFVAIQRGRTVAAAEEFSQMADRMAKTAVRPAFEAEGFDAAQLDRLTIRPNDPVAEALSLHTRTWPLFSDLRPIILVDNSKTGFVTSDSPVVFFNTLLQHVSDRGTTGAQSPGLQIFLPLSSEVTLLLQDENVYGTGRGSPSTLVICPEDVNQLNALQIVNAEENIYFNSNKTNRDAVLSLVQKHRHKKPATKAQMEYRASFRMNGVEYRGSHLFFNPQSSIRLSLSGIKLLKRATPVAADWQQHVMPRRPDLVEILERFQKMVDQSQVRNSDILRFLVQALNPNNN